MALTLAIAVVPARSAPTIVATSPQHCAIGIARSSSVVIQFAQDLDPATIDDSSVLVVSSLRGICPGTVSWDAVQREIEFEPDENFLAGERVTVTVTKDVQDLLGDPLPNGFSYQFTTWTGPALDRAFSTEPVPGSTGSIAFNATVADLNGDRHPEVIFSNVVWDSLTIYDADGTGAFAVRPQISVPDMPRHVAVGDVTGDGSQDLVCCSTLTNSIVVLPNDGFGNFAAFQTHAVGDAPYGCALADLDADGDLDVAVAHFNSHDIGIMINDGTGSFTTTFVPLPQNSEKPVWIDAGDMDRDGDLDLVSGNLETDDLSVLLNDGSAGFTFLGSYPAGGEQPERIALADMDGDAILDVVSVNVVSGTASVVPGLGDGSLGTPRVTGFLGQFPHGLQVVDLDGDIDLDAVVPVRGANAWRPLWNDGNGSLIPGELYPGGSHCHTIGAADWDEDGDIDVVAGFAISQNAYLYRNSAAPSVASVEPPRHSIVPAGSLNELTIDFSTGLAPVSLGPGAFRVEGTQSGPVTIAVGWSEMDNRVTLTPTHSFLPGERVRVTVTNDVNSATGIPFQGHTYEFMVGGAAAQGVFQAQPSIALPGDDPLDIVASDFDGDLRPDLAIATFLSDEVTLVMSGGGGLPSIVSTVPVESGPSALWAGELDGNGEPDLAVVNIVAGSISVLHNSGGTLLVSTSVPLSGAPFAITGGDLDRDGDTDLVVSELGPDGLEIFWNDGSGLFAGSLFLATQGPTLDAALFDLNGDGFLDIVAVDGFSSRVEVFIGDGAGFESVGTWDVGTTPLDVLPWDFQGDGIVDLATVDYGADGLTLLPGTTTPGGVPSFGAASVLSATKQPRAVFGADLNGDGALDLAVPNSGTGDVTVFRNQGGGAFDAVSTGGVGLTPYAITGGDFDLDGRVDLCVVTRGNSSVTMLLSGSATDGPEGPGLSLTPGLGSPFPNPFTSDVSILFGLQRTSPVRLDVFDVRGRRLATLVDAPLDPGRHVISWDGRDASGRPVAAGVYFVRLHAQGERWSEKVLRLR